MSSKEQLLRNIEELSANIERQKIFLLQLEASRSDARRALNALCSPIARLPVETLSHIFTLCMPFSKDELESLEPDPLSVPLLLLHICHLWRDIALFTPAFWGSIHFKRPQFKAPVHVNSWLSRGRHRPLSIGLTNLETVEVEEVLGEYSAQVYTLTLCSFLSPNVRTPGWMCSFTSLRTLKLLDCQNLSTSDCLDCLRSASLLEDLSLAYLDKRMGASLASESLPIVLHTSLKTLRLKPDKQIPCPPRILRYLTLPALQYLSLFQISQDGGLMSDFFTRSSPPLDYLEIGYLHPQSAPELGYLSLLPSLTQLILQYHQAASSIFRKLAVDAGLLPNLQRLIVISTTNLHVYAELVELLAACKGRHGVLLSIYASFAYGEVEPVPPNFLDELQRGTQGGSLHLHVGPGFEVNEVECLCSNSYLH